MDLNAAVRRGNVEEVKRLLATVDVNSANDGGITALHTASIRGHVVIAELLIRGGANVNMKGYDGCTPLHYSLSYTGSAITELLLASGADVNLRNYRGNTVLHHAAEVGLRKLSEVLVCWGASLNVQNSEGHTPLHRAILYRHYDVTEFLIISGSDVNLKDGEGNTPLHLACDRRDYSAVEALLKNGAIVEARNAAGLTPLFITASIDIVDVLVEYGAKVDPEIFRHRKWSRDHGVNSVFGRPDCMGDRGVINLALALMDYVSRDIPVNNFDELSTVIPTREFSFKPIVAGLAFQSIKLKVAKLGLISSLSPLDPRLADCFDTELAYYQNLCELEIEKMKCEKIETTNVSYVNVFYLVPSAYRRLADSGVTLIGTLSKCLELFPHYGRLLYHRSKLGFRRISLIDKCYSFFPLIPEAPELPVECMDEILSFLGIHDLVNLARTCT